MWLNITEYIFRQYLALNMAVGLHLKLVERRIACLSFSFLLCTIVYKYTRFPTTSIYFQFLYTLLMN